MDPNGPIAVIGMSCRFPGNVRDPESLWQLCAEGKSGYSEIPVSKFNRDSFYHPNPEKVDSSNVIGGHFLDEDVGFFDAGFFNLSSEAAAALDPQFRLQLESTHEALESAGITIQDVAGSNTSFFGGAFFRDYSDAQLRDPETLPRLLLLGVGSAMASNRISHFYDLRGASMTIDTGCSTTLTALHQACQSLRTGESSMSIVGGTNVMLNPDNFMIMSSIALLGKTGKSFAFDSRAEGYGRGEGSATVILKRLDDAIRDADPVRAIIRASAINQDGKTETVTTPNQEAQEQLIRACYERAELDLSQTLFFEAHGTGTPTGDPIEARAVASIFKSTRSRDQPLRIGSVKTNVGHTETTSGLASIIKVALALEKGKIPPNANFEKPNEKIRLDEWHLKVPTQLEDWPEETGIRRASINNFGFGGANAHVVMQDYQSFVRPRYLPRTTNGATHHANGINGINGINGVNEYHKPRNPHIIILSAKDEQACSRMVSNLRDHLLKAKIDDEESFFASLAHTLDQRRSKFPWVAALGAANIADFIKSCENGRMKPSRQDEVQPRIGYVYTGQGAQWYAMGRELINTYPVFRDCLLEADGYLKEFGATWSLIDELEQDEQTSRVHNTNLGTPLCVALQIALTRLLQSWRIIPNAVTSHSSGELAAACTVGAISLRSTMAGVFFRGEMGAGMTGLVQRKGAMIAVGLGAEELQPYLARISSGQLVAACLNSPLSTTVSGDASAVEELEAMLKEEQIFARRLKVEAAWHSHHVQPIAKPYRASLEKHFARLDGELTDVVYVSPTTGRCMTSLKDINNPQHWVDSLVNPVRFIEAFRNMCFDGARSAAAVDVVIEVGPHGALSGPISDIMATFPEFGDRGNISYLTCLVRKNNAVSTMQALACELLRKGYQVDIEAVNFPLGRNKHHVSVLHDLPCYPWNHSTRYWREPRVNKLLRHRQGKPHDLLGSLALGCNMLTPSWRHVIRVSDLPWIRDHIVQGNIVYPGAGFLCMAIEAEYQYQHQRNQHEHIRGYQLLDVNILQALVVPESPDGVEVLITLRPCSTKNLSATGWEEFQVCSVSSENHWLEHCNGLIKADVQLQPPSQSVTLSTEADYRMRLELRDLYAGLRCAGISHGPIFQNLRNIRTRDKQSVSAFIVADTASTMPSHYQHQHTLHPTTLDTVFQAAYTALPGAGSKTTNAQIPRSIKHLWVVYDIISDPGHQFSAYTKLNHSNAQNFEVDIAVVDGNGANTAPVLIMDGFLCQSIGNASTQQSISPENEKLVRLRWAPDISFLKPAFLKQRLSRPVDPAEIEILLDLKQLCVYFFNETLAALTVADVQQLGSHLKKFYIWMKHQVDLADLDKLAPGSSRWRSATSQEKAALIAKASAQSLNGEMVCLLGSHLTAILRHQKAPLELMMENGFLNRYYEKSLKWDRSTWQLGELTKHLTHKNPRAKVLEIGAGTGGATMSILKAIGTDACDGGPLASSYDYTDLSSSFFEAAQEKLEAWKSLLKYKKLDIEQDPSNQGFEEGSYDLIVACQVLHATKSIYHTMGRVRKLLKPGGKLLLMETTHDALDIQFAFGLLPGWWLSEEEERKSSPSLSVDMWDDVLHKTGFNGAELEVHDCDSEEFYSFSCILSTAVAEAPSFNSDVVLVTQDSAPRSWLEALKESIAKVTGGVPTVETLGSVKGNRNNVYIFLGEIDHPVLKSPDVTEFETLKTLCTSSNGILWVTRGGALSCENVDVSLSIGFLRTLRMEYRGKRLVSLDLDPKQDSWSVASVASIKEIFERTFDDATSNVTREFEYIDRGGIISVPRFYKDIAWNKRVFPCEKDLLIPQTEPLYQKDRPLRLMVGTPGLLDTLAWSDDPDAGQELEADIVEVEAIAFGQNFRDVLKAMGQLNSHIWGMECSGAVSRVGSKAALQGFKPGDRVAMLLRGFYGNLARVHWTSVMHIPDDMSFEIAASIPLSFCSAYLSIYNSANLQKGETILIHAAAGAFGQAAVLLAKNIGADIFVTVGTETKKQFVMKTYGIQSDHIFSSRDTSFALDILAMTKGRGVDVVLNSLSGLLLQESVNCLAPFGRFVEIGKRDFEQNNHLALGTFTRAISFISLDQVAFADLKPFEMCRVFKEVMRLFNDKVIVPVDPITVYPASELEKAFRIMQAGKHVGKIVISMEPDCPVPVLPQTPSAKLRPDCSYLIVGGLGGIGRSVCLWMANHGARNIIVISRSASSSGKPASFLAEMADFGCRVKLAGCDVSDGVQMAEVLSNCAQEMPPIRGVIQGAMVLQDSILERMTIDDWNAAVRPKVQGSWNLHQQTQNLELEFFIMLSSLVGIVGYTSQSNYSAGGAFEDALASYRTARGLPAVTIDLGPVKSVGYAAERDGTAERLLKDGIGVVSEAEVLQTIEFAILSPFATQLIVGLHTGPGSHWEDGGSMSRDAKFSALTWRSSKESTNAKKPSSTDLGGRIAAATSMDEAADVVLSEITTKLMNIFMIPESEIVPSKPLSAYGVDSLVAVELRNMLALWAGAEISIFDIMQSTSIIALATTVASKSSHLDAALVMGA